MSSRKDSIRAEGSYISTSIGSRLVTVASAWAWPAVTRSPTDTAATLAMPSMGLVTVVQSSSACARVSAASAACSAASACSRVARDWSTCACVVPDPSNCSVRPKDVRASVSAAWAELTWAWALFRFAS